MKCSIWIGILAVALTVVLTGCSSKQRGEAAYQQIPMNEAAEMMEQEEDYILLDVRTEEEFRGKHIPGAINIPNETIEEEPAALPDKEQMIFVYCRSGNRSKQAAQKLADLGYTNIIEIGGIIDWKGEVVIIQNIMWL